MKSRKIDTSKELVNNFEADRKNALELFESIGFEIVQKQTWKKFDKIVNGVLVKIVL